MNTRSIHFRLILWYSSLIIVVALAFSTYMYQSIYYRLTDEMQQRLARRNKQIADNIMPHIPDKSPAEIANTIHITYSPEANNRFIRILNSDHSVFYISDNPKDGQFNPASIPIPAGDIPRTRMEQINPDLAISIVATPTEVQGQTYYIETGGLMEGIQTALHSLILTLLFGLPFIILIAAMGVYVVVRHSLKPVENIRAKAEQITFGNLSNRLPVEHTGDELEHLSVTLNQMLERLHDAYQQATRFSADASHELRTPLSFMLGELETMAEDPHLPEPFRGRIGSIFEETERLAHIAENLFAISRLDAGEAKIKHVRFDLASLVQNTSEQMAVLAEEKNIAIAIMAPAPVPIYGDPARLKQVVINLLDNAIKYTPKGGNITLKILVTGQKATLEVMDNGAGIPADALPHIFERFYRADKERSRELGGAGLGLSIVRSICQAHAGNVEIQSIEGKGTICKVELPLADGQEQQE